AEAESTYEYGQEALSAETSASESTFESPLTTESFDTEQEIMRTRDQFPKTCGDTTFTGKPWNFGKTNQSNTGRVSNLTFVPRAEVFEFQLTQFDVDRHELKQQHKDAIADFTRRVQAGLRAK